jgi:transglutaminase-like putative cysteine protease
MGGRRAAAWAVLAVWAAVVGMHIRREYFRPETERLALGARALAPGSHFYSVRMDGAAIGLATARLDTVPDGFILEDNLILDVPALGGRERAAAVTRMRLTRTLDLAGFEFRLDSRIGRFAVHGAAAEDGFEVRVDSGAGAAEASRVRAPPGTLLDAAVTTRLAAAGGLAVGREAAVTVFDASTLSTREVRIRVTAVDTILVADSVTAGGDGRWVAAGWDTVPVWRVEQTFSGIAVASWVDADGLTVRAESPLGFTIERTAYELADQAWRDARDDPSLAEGYGVLIEGTAIASNVRLDDLGARDALAVRLRGVDLAGFDLDGGRQRLRGDTLFVTREPPAALSGTGWSLPWHGGGAQAEALEATPLIQADDPRIVRAARDAVAGVEAPVEAARRLNAWVYRSVRKQVTPSVPSAVQVLEALEGDCNEHTVLYVAMARAIGLPARTAVGLVHIGGRFYYHAWPEVWLDDWVAVDPTLGQFPADAGHLRFLTGGLARQIELIRLIGRLQIEVQ